MSRKIRVRISWRKEEALRMAGIARCITSAMTDNSNFTNPDVPLRDIEKAATRTENAWGNRKNGPVAKDELNN